MDTVTSAVTTLFTLLGNAYEFIVGKPLLLLLFAVPLVGAVVALISGIFRRGG